MAKSNIIRVGDVEILALSDGMLEFDLCNFFPTIPGEQWQPHGSHLTDEHKVRFNLGSYLIRSSGWTISWTPDWVPVRPRRPMCRGANSCAIFRPTAFGRMKWTWS